MNSKIMMLLDSFRFEVDQNSVPFDNYVNLTWKRYEKKVCTI